MRAVWRVLTSVLFHAGLLHIVFNMLAFVPIGLSLEKHMGTVQVGAWARCRWAHARMCTRRVG